MFLMGGKLGAGYDASFADDYARNKLVLVIRINRYDYFGFRYDTRHIEHLQPTLIVQVFTASPAKLVALHI